MYYKGRITISINRLISSFLCCTTFLAISVYIVFNPVSNIKGLFLLPLTLSILCLFAGDVISQYKTSMGLSVLLVTILLRYAISPLLISLSGSIGYSGVITVSKSGSEFAVIMSIIELVAVFITLKMIWNKKPKHLHHYKNADFKMTALGWMFVIFLLAIIIIRGNFSSLLSYLSGLLDYEKEQIYSIDLIAILAIKNIIYIAVLSWAKRKYKINYPLNYNYYFLIALIASTLNILINDPFGRAITIETMLATIACLLYAFPDKRKTVITFGALVGVTIIGGSIIYLNLGYANGSLKHIKNIGNLSYMLETYVNGISITGWAYDKRESIKMLISLKTFFSDIVNSINPLQLPILSMLKFGLQDVKTTSALFNGTMSYSIGYILPFAGESVYYFGIVLGGIFDVCYCVVCTILLRNFDYKAKDNSNIEYQYICVFCSIIFAAHLCYNAMIVISSLTYIPLYIHVIAKLNMLGKRSR